jgi:hypothetical protein
MKAEFPSAQDNVVRYVIDAHTKRQSRNSTSTKRHKLKKANTQNSTRHKTAISTKQNTAQNGIRHKTAHGTKQRKAQNGVKHKNCTKSFTAKFGLLN